MHPKLAELMPGSLIANVVGKKNGHILCQIRLLREGARNQPGPSRVQDAELRAKQVWYALHHGLYPVRIPLRANAILNHRFQKRMTRLRAEAVVADFPIHLVLAAQVSAERQFLERKHATVRK